MPTETVYGLGADAEQPAAVARIFEVKGRPPTHPLIVHVGAVDDLARWVTDVPPHAAVLAETCWPGPLTLLLRRSSRVPDAVTGGRDTVGVRVPAHPATLQVLARTGGGLAAPSANRYGAVSPTTVGHVLDDLGSLLDPSTDVILDGGPSPVGVESTIVDCTVEPPQILRPGGIPTETVVELIGAVAAVSGPARAAGMVASHYVLAGACPPRRSTRRCHRRVVPLRCRRNRGTGDRRHRRPRALRPHAVRRATRRRRRRLHRRDRCAPATHRPRPRHPRPPPKSRHPPLTYPSV